MYLYGLIWSDSEHRLTLTSIDYLKDCTALNNRLFHALLRERFIGLSNKAELQEPDSLSLISSSTSLVQDPMPGQSLCSDTGADMASDVVGLGKHATCRCRCGSIKHSLSITIDSPGCTMPSPKSPTSPSKRPCMQLQVSSGSHRCRFVFAIWWRARRRTVARWMILDSCCAACCS